MNNEGLRLWLFTVIVFISSFFASGRIWALPVPGDKVLIIYTDDSCDGGNTGFAASMVANLQAALAALPGGAAPTVTTEQTTCSATSTVGIQSNLPAGGLSQFCEVYDLRFISYPGYQSCSAGGDSSMITSSGANNDTQLYLGYLAQGGHLILMGDNSGFCNRDSSLVSFVAAATGCNLGWNINDVISNSSYNWTTFNSPLQGAYNTLTTYGSNYPGYIASGGICNATALTTSGSDVLDMLWTGNQLTTDSGQLELNMDTGGLAGAMAGYQAYWQNVYALNATCYNFTVTKTVSPATVCVGQSVTFSVCLQNTGSQALTNPQITDVIPSCMGYVSSTPGGSASGNNFSYTYSGTLAAGQSACVSIVATANSTTCP